MKTIVLLFILLWNNIAIAKSSLTHEQIKSAYHESFKQEALGNIGKSISALQPIYKTYPYTYTLQLRFGWLYYIYGKYSNSSKHYENAIALNPASLNAKIGLINVLLTQEKYNDAEIIAYQILNTDLYNYYANLKLVFSLRMQAKYENAIAVANKMLTVYPTDLAFLEELALNYSANGQSDAANSVFGTISILNPKQK